MKSALPNLLENNGMTIADVKIVEVSPRDGLQNEAQIIPSDIKVTFINALSETGLKTIEVTSFVSPRRIPQLADNQIVFQKINKKEGISYPALVPNVEGLTRALACGIKEIAVFTTPSEQFSAANTHCSVAESLARIKAIMTIAKPEGLKVRGYVSCVWGCPYEGKINEKQVISIVEALLDLGCDEISLGDTIGVATPKHCQALLKTLMRTIPQEKLAVHFHDTYGCALANIYSSLEMGITIIDSAVSGLGGCPYAKGATGNVATEEVVYLLHGMGIKTGVDLDKLMIVGRKISFYLGRPTRSKVNAAKSAGWLEVGF